MPTILPYSPAKWRELVARTPRSRVQLWDGESFESASKFTSQEFLRLRILYKQGGRVELATILKNQFGEELRFVWDTFKNNEDINQLKEFHHRSKNGIKSWSHNASKDVKAFAVAMELLYNINRGDVEPPDDEDEQRTSKVYISPRKTRSMTRQLDALANTLSGSRIDNSPLHQILPQTPPPKTKGPQLDGTPSFASDVLSTPGEVQELEDRFERGIFPLGDEQTVNFCLVSFLMPISWIIGKHGSVHLDRVTLQVAREGDVLFKAAVDGIVSETSDKKSLQMIIETKRHLRDNGVRIQEGAQMAALINSSEEVLGRGQMTNWSLSMDGYSAWITRATYDKKYADFLAGSGNVFDEPFLEMVEYGPYDLRKLEDLQTFLEYAAVLMKVARPRELKGSKKLKGTAPR